MPHMSVFLNRFEWIVFLHVMAYLLLSLQSFLVEKKRG